MATLTFRVDSENEAFATDSDARAECARLLRKAAQALDDGADGGRLMDANGNRCGAWDYDAPETDDETDDN